MKFLADHCVPESLCLFLEDLNHEVIRLKSILSPNSSDLVVINKSQDLDAILFSLNGDFNQIVAYPPKLYKGIFSIRLKNNPQDLPSIEDNIKKFLINKQQSDFVGKLVMITSKKIRIR